MNKVILGDCIQVMKNMPDNSIDSIVTDPPYELGFMGKSWDNTGIANNKEMWAEALRVLKPGGHLLAFSGTRTYHRMACAIEDAGFEVRDMIEWIYSTGFPKSRNLNKALQKKCTCGNMEVYDNERTKQDTEHDLRPMSESDLSQKINTTTEQGEVLQSELSEQSVSLQQSESTENVRREESLLERWNNIEKTEGELQGSDISEVSKGISSDGKERRIHNATQVSDGTTSEKIIDENGSSASHRPQSEQQQDRKPCAFCKQLGTQETRRLYEATYGVGSALKPAHEPICLARKPLSEKTLVDNFIKYGTGGINIDESRVENTGKSTLRPLGKSAYQKGGGIVNGGVAGTHEVESEFGGGHDGGRFPANLIHDNSEEVRECFPETKTGKAIRSNSGGKTFGGDNTKPVMGDLGYEDGGGNASRFFKSVEQKIVCPKCGSNNLATDKKFPAEYHCDNGCSFWFQLNNIENFKSIIYQAKASKSERNKGCEGLEESDFAGGSIKHNNLQARCSQCNDRHYDCNGQCSCGKNEWQRRETKNNHPTVKPIALMEYLIKMVTPKGGIVLDPFAGSGSTLVAAKQNGFKYVGIEMTEEYIPIIEARLKATDNTLF
jgi:DNA modification methylase